MSIELTYFDGPGRGELARLVLHAGGVAFADTRVEMKDWPEMKGDATKAPAQLFGSMPCLKVGDVQIAQSQAVSLYAAELALNSMALSGAQRAVDTMILSVHADLQTEMYKTLYGSDESKAAGKAALPAAAAKFLTKLEALLPASGFLHGGAGPSLGDLAIFDNVTSVFPGLPALGVDMAPYPKIAALVTAVAAVPALQPYLAKRGYGPKAGIELMYFDGPGRAELPRLVLHAGGVAFADTRLEMKDWPAIKTDATKMPAQLFGSIPCLKVGDVQIAQSRAVSLYAAELALNSTALSGGQRAVDAMILSVHADLHTEMYKTQFGSDESKAAGKAALPAAAAKFLIRLESMVPDKGFLHAGAGPSLGDLAIFDNVTSVFPGLPALGVDMAPYPKIAALVKAVAAVPALAAYLKGRGF